MVLHPCGCTYTYRAVRPEAAIHPRILLFDDEADILELCTIILQARGYEVFTRTSSNEVLTTIAEVSPDIIFMDCSIPDVGGVEATRQIKAHPQYSQIPVVLCSANADVNYLSAQAGADTYLPKPFDIGELEGVIHRVLSGSGVRIAA
jgi:two-component system alkaline phosphatase synthesis response regulator PhoP